MTFPPPSLFLLTLPLPVMCSSSCDDVTSSPEYRHTDNLKPPVLYAFVFFYFILSPPQSQFLSSLHPSFTCSPCLFDSFLFLLPSSPIPQSPCTSPTPSLHFSVLHGACLSLSPPSPALCQLISKINGFISIVSPWWWIMSLIIISLGWRIMSLIRIFFFSSLEQHVKESKPHVGD